MAKRRTKQDKVTARHLYTFRFNDTPTPTATSGAPTTIHSPVLLVGRDYVVKDLIKTALISLFTIALEMIIYRYWSL